MQKVEDVCIGAFVTFNHEESFLRCAQEYHGSKSLLRRLFQKRHLRFRGKNRLRVDPAPNPSDVRSCMWVARRGWQKCG